MVLTAMSFAEGAGKPAIHAVVPVRVVKGLGIPAAERVGVGPRGTTERKHRQGLIGVVSIGVRAGQLGGTGDLNKRDLAATLPLTSVAE